MSRRSTWKQGWAACLFALGCAGEPADLGQDEPLWLDRASLHAGTLAEPPTKEPETKLGITNVELNASTVRPGETRVVGGRVGGDAVALAVQLAGASENYWVQQVETLDPQFPGERGWAFQAVFGHKVPQGPQRVRVAGIDAAGAMGPARDIKLCVLPSFPDNLNACDPKRKPPAMVVQITWDRLADLDLEVTRPDGSLISAKESAKAGETLPPGKLLVDSGAACVNDGLRTEYALWEEKPAAGTYTIRTRLFSGCNQPAVRWKVRVLVRAAGQAADTWQMKEVAGWQGEFLAAQADGGLAPALTVGEITL